MIIYLDMDDVVADWIPSARAIVNRDWTYGSDRVSDEDWNKVRAKHRFYRDLPIKDGAFELVQFCRDAVANGLASDLRFLTALPHNNDVPYAAYDKVLWATERFERIPVLFGPYSYDKHKHCQPGDILIDDRVSNCEEWKAAGGLSHIYRTWEACRPWLEQTLNPMPKL
jgi:5'(3')-deoxyribonucleotidase